MIPYETKGGLPVVKKKYLHAGDEDPQPRYYWGLSNPYPGSAPDIFNDYLRWSETLEESEGHPVHLLGKTDRDIGGDFKVVKNAYSESNNSAPRDFSMTSNPLSSGRHHLTGQWAWKSSFSDTDFPNVSVSSKIALAAFGTTAIARVIPTNPLAGLAVALGELRSEGLPSLVGLQTMRGRTLRARSAGGEYLNVQFGWLPLVSDIEAMSNSFSNSDELTREYERNSGKRLKRRYAFPDEISFTTTNMGTGRPVPALTPTGFYLGGTRTLFRYSYRKVRRWFSGCFTYYLPPYQANGDNRKRNAQLRNYLYGTRLTPETAWNLAPWTWAADWVANFGDIVHNVTAFANDGLVMPYGYMMEESTGTDTYIHNPITYQSYPSGVGALTQTFTRTVKQRIRATPFGFGLDPGSFTGRQWAILGALGLSRGDNHL